MPRFDFGHRIAMAGWTKDTEDFDYIMSHIWWTDFAKKSLDNVEQLLFNPLNALQYCHDVRAKAGIWVTDCEILQRLSNLRKNKYLEATKPD